jgi:putative ABC transport system permease protein
MSGAAILSLALAIGANTAVFTLVNAVFLRGLPVTDVQDLVAVHASEAGQAYGEYMPMSRPNLLDLKQRTNIFSSLVEEYFLRSRFRVGTSGMERVSARLVSSGYFTTLGVEAHIGQLLHDQGRDELTGSEPVVVLSHRFWQQRFAADPGVSGTEIRLDDHPFTVIGVAPPGFVGTLVFSNPDCWVPVSMRSVLMPDAPLDDRRIVTTSVIGRLAPGVTIDRARAELDGVARGLEQDYPEANHNRGLGLLPIAQLTVPIYVRQRFIQVGGLMMGLVGLVLLIAIANIANLLLARASARRHEMSVRLALGATRRHLAGLLTAESLVLSGCAGVLGLVLGVLGRNALWALRPTGMLNSGLDISIDPRVVGFNLALTLTTCLLLGLTPALLVGRGSAAGSLSGSRLTTPGAIRLLSLRNLLVMGQVALSFVALVSAGLFIKSLDQALAIDPGFRPEQLVLLDLDLGHMVQNAEQAEVRLERVTNAVRSLPEVAAASRTTLMPLEGRGAWLTIMVTDRDPAHPQNRVMVPVGQVGADLSAAMGCRLLAGRDINRHDRADTSPVAVINKALADRLWPDQEAVGERFYFLEENGLSGREVTVEVVGVISNFNYNRLGVEPQPLVLAPCRQNPVTAMTLVVRATGSPQQLAARLRHELGRLEPDLLITRVDLGPQLVYRRLWPARTGARLLATLAVVALVLAVIGIYGVMAYSTALRRRELSIRLALGADRQTLLRLILGHGVKVAVLGLMLGAVLALAAGRLLTSMLYDVQPSDPSVLAMAGLALALVALIANLVPARRATALQPADLLRDDG